MSSDRAPERSVSLPVGVVVRRAPGVTRWAKWSWRATAVLPGAASADWVELRREGDAVEYHAATADLTLHRSETEAYIPALANTPPLCWVIMRADRDGGNDRPELLLVTVSAYEAQDYADNGEDIVEAIPMPDGLAAWVDDFVKRHHVDEEFVKRKRKRHFEDLKEDGIGDARVRQPADVYRAPSSIKRKPS
ncbi:DUF3305 domain-containing protein [Ovoidimarina sediminis]|uniref:DUF3305 domain-containing protein n=1 Tax=Ovoidimarina sediminis TaxID=3079856 RepID=UPI00290CA24A|nr:DUF3305 domain-containing protein [Rhodophyticola sp. MJ-SS7]MDU8942055.1 DUF3305 domain-containing protein [Rhodophyticola sp. MJ-SS7]